MNAIMGVDSQSPHIDHAKRNASKDMIRRAFTGHQRDTERAQPLDDQTSLTNLALLKINMDQNTRRRLLNIAIRRISTMTPEPFVAVSDISRCTELECGGFTKWQLTMVFIDEAERMPEPQFYALSYFFQPTFVVNTRDVHLLNPMSSTL
ncbi:hypothetical protein Cob_v009805 [Colletotrichum orbiculare MAFF 240422]|uniref:Uncharacterized protein n=1 Tax=Colletotrichum orbiculare (strain 104-T / ATCC 96160 / CBS 514.97 / LARS 414 / MAFF 240422) TaxID=1213857 RepID=N4VYB7_COLOR|nr:hypothetical protein Cob_v009805 [Colletotrichum orbiculare MAFF 240422]